MRRGIATLLTTALVLGAAPIVGLALPSSTAIIDAVEEDWQLVVETPDPVEAGPQITTSMRPTVGDNASFIDFDLNYREYPDFDPGGMQIQVWSGEDCVQTATQQTAQLDTPGETVSWTQRMSVSGGTITYNIVNGQSTTWGQFGQGEGQLSVSQASSVSSLSGYSPDDSVARSGVSWQSNHVTSLTLKQVRYYAAGVLVNTDTTPRTVNLNP
ncbi:MAG TPA: hypothetical protein VG406_27480 [Isosphaeraceae bacterium]|jgi:hypothetical protein|nr:hypothetical protein [Isosphaeraceae bacterium]